MSKKGYVQTLVHRNKCSKAKKGKSFEQIYGVEGAKAERRKRSRASKIWWRMKKGESVTPEIERIRREIAKLQKKLKKLERYELRKKTGL